MKVCEITGKVAIVGNNVSHSHHKTKRKFSPNLKTKRFWSEQEGSDDDSVYLPYTTAMRLSNESSPDSYSAIMVDEGQANEAKAAVEQELYDIFKSDNAYYVYSASEWLEEMNKIDRHGHRHPHWYRQHLAAGGRHRHHEHHAGVRHRAHP